MNESNEKKITIEYEKAKNCQTVAATGVWGGPNPQGEIICNFFIEHQNFPQSSLIIDKNTGALLREEHTDVESTVREIQVRVVMRPDVAKTIGEWMIKRSEIVSIQS